MQSPVLQGTLIAATSERAGPVIISLLSSGWTWKPLVALKEGREGRAIAQVNQVHAFKHQEDVCLPHSRWKSHHKC